MFHKGVIGKREDGAEVAKDHRAVRVIHNQLSEHVYIPQGQEYIIEFFELIEITYISGNFCDMKVLRYLYKDRLTSSTITVKIFKDTVYKNLFFSFL